MIGFIRLGFFLLIVLSVLYVLISVYARSLERERLEKRWDSGHGTGERDAYIEEGMARYQKSLRRRLLWGVYIVPVVVISVLVYVLNFG
ncbi:hypothetical protein [Gemmobacter nectariphilus]|uniref:hypothetical protein n=1 Tax=Gemmobacter nectariphilus TaxID=220343 RepID=UPI00042959C2|nr:hypothetical protein [Gemmobacter nectariphilus]